MSSERRQEASRANGAESRCPVTEEGKQASSRNSRTHGLLSKKIVLEGESQEEFDALLNSYLEEHQPESATERSLIESMAAARWRQERFWTLETAAMDDQMRRPRYFKAEEDFASKAYVAFHTLANAGPSFELLNPYERQFRAALNTFLSLRAKRTLFSAPISPPNATRKKALPKTHRVRLAERLFQPNRRPKKLCRCLIPAA